MKVKLMDGLRLLIGVCALVGAALAHADPVTVHYTVYNSRGAIKSDAKGTATGIVNTPGSNAWVNNPTLIDPEHSGSYLVNFWIAAQDMPIWAAGGDYDVKWTFDYTLAYGALIKGDGNTAIKSVTANTSITIGTERSGWMRVAGTFATDTVGKSFVQTAGAGAVHIVDFGSAATNKKTVSALEWDGGATTSVWAYISTSDALSLSGAFSSSFQNYGTVTALADVANPLVLTDGGKLLQDGGGAVPEPGSLALLCGAGMVGLAFRRRRRDRLKPVVISAV